MATYGLKYTTYVEKGGTRITLNIYCKGYTGSTLGIGALRGLSMSIQGAQGGIYAPVVKTSVSFSLPDQWDIGTDGVKDGVRYGQWHEFYTNDITRYKVELKKGTSAMWTGFITPDSWGEDVSHYHGDVKIVARDMLGYLSEQEFDLTGSTTIRNLLTTAMSRSEAAMTADLVGAEMLVNSNGHNILDHTIDAATFAGRSWYDALEQTLEALGMVLRYDGANGWFATSLRYLAGHALGSAKVPVMTGGSGYRTLDPAVKSITDTVNFNWVDYDAPTVPVESQSKDTSADPFESKVAYNNGLGQRTVTTTDLDRYKATTTAWNAGSLAMPPALATGFGDTPTGTMYLPASCVDDAPPAELLFWNTFHDARLTGSVKLTVKQVAPILSEYFISAQSSVSAGTRPVSGLEIAFVKMRVRAVNGSATEWLNGGVWVSEYSDGCLFNQQLGAELEIPQTEGDIFVDVGFVALSGEIAMGNLRGVFRGAYVPLQLIFAAGDRMGAADEQKTTLNYVSDNHAVIKRSPAIGSINGGVPAVFSRNALSYDGRVAPNAWNWSGASSYYPLAVMVQCQLLVYYASMNGNSIYTGNAIWKDYGGIPTPGYNYTYFGATCVMMSGQYDFATAMMSGVTLREVMDWDDVWDTPFAPDFTEKSGYGRGSTSAAGGGGSSSSGGTGGGGLTPAQRTLLANLDSWFGYDPDNNAVFVKKDADGNPRNFFTFGENAGGGITGQDGGGGSSVSWSQLVTSGTKIATITINGVATDVYAPAGGSAGSYNDLSGKPSINSVELSGNKSLSQLGIASVSALAAKQDKITASNKLSYSLLLGVPTELSQFTDNLGSSPVHTHSQYLTASALTGYATQSWVTGRGYITATALNGYATESWVTGKGYITSAALSSYATQNWVNSQLGGYLPKTGGTLTRRLTINDASSAKPLILNTTYTGATSVRTEFQVGGTSVGTFEYGLDSAWLKLFVSDGKGNGYGITGLNGGNDESRYGKLVAIKNVGTGWATYEFWHAGNSGDYTYDWKCKTLYAAGHITPRTAETYAVGLTSMPFAEVHANKWYPNKNDTSHYIEYVNGHWLIHGDAACTGDLAASYITA